MTLSAFFEQVESPNLIREEAMDASRPYTRDEVIAAISKAPDRGTYCPRCENFIPEFADISPQEAAEIRELTVGKAMDVVQHRTGCSRAWAKIWAIHPDGPHEARPAPVPCPYCDLPLNPQAKQCPLCKMDWHNPDKIVQRSESLVDMIFNAAEGSTIEVNSRFSLDAARQYAELKRPDARLNFTIHASTPE